MNNQALVVSFHDVAPHSQEACEQFLDDMRELGIDCVTLLVVPNWDHSAPIDEHPAFVEWLQRCAAEGHEIQLHGYSHKAREIRGGVLDRWIGTVYTAREGEFQTLTGSETRELLDKGEAHFSRAGLSFCGFTAPAWLLSPSARQVLIEKNIGYTTYLAHIERLRDERRVFAPTLVYSSRSAWRRWVSRAWTRIWQAWNQTRPIVRIAAHPIDLSFPAIRDSMRRRVERARENRTVMTYRDAIAALDELSPSQSA